MATKEMKKEESRIEVKLEPIKVNTVKVKIVGKTPLIMDRLPEDVQNRILAKQTGAAMGNKKMTRDTTKEVSEAIHVTSKGTVGIPAFSFKGGMMECTSFVGDKMFSKKLVSGAVRIVNAEDGLIPIKYSKQTVLKHNIGHNTKFSPCFHDWTCELIVKYDGNNISAADIITLLDYAGFYIGVGAWRPHCRDGGSGEYGMYETSKVTQ